MLTSSVPKKIGCTQDVNISPGGRYFRTITNTENAHKSGAAISSPCAIAGGVSELFVGTLKIQG